jgi:hypothetical protein
MAHFAGGESLRLRILEAERSFARCAEGLRCQLIPAPDRRDSRSRFSLASLQRRSDVFPIVLKFSSQLSLRLRSCEKMNRGAGRRKRLPHIDVHGFGGAGAFACQPLKRSPITVRRLPLRWPKVCLDRPW